MSVTPEEQADQFLLQIAAHQAQLIKYACTLTRCPDAGYDLYADTLLRCRERIAVAGFFGDSVLPYMVTAIRLNFYSNKRSEKIMESISNSYVEEEDDQLRPNLATAISAHVAAHYPPEEVAVFELHVAGQTYPEIAFLTQYTYWQAYQMVKRMKREIREMFKGGV